MRFFRPGAERRCAMQLVSGHVAATGSVGTRTAHTLVHESARAGVLVPYSGGVLGVFFILTRV